MNFRRQALISLIFVLSYMCLCRASPRVLQSAKYDNSFSLARLTHTRVQQLLQRYKEQQLGDKHFEDRSLQSTSLPSLSTEFYSWLEIKDFDRLHAAYLDLHTYWRMLEQKKRQMREEEIGQWMVDRHRTKPGFTLRESIEHIQHDLRDLMTQVYIQMRHRHSSGINPTLPTVPAFSKSTQSHSQTLWSSRLEGYVILRDLDLYLTKLSRDFLLLVSKNNHASLVTEQ